MKEITFTVIGFGHIGRRHAAIINGFPGARLVAIIDTDPAATLQPSYPLGIPFYNSWESYQEEMVPADVVNIATPNANHCHTALLAVNAGSHVVIEKPMGIHAADCVAVIAAAAAHNKQVFVVKQNRYSASARWLKEMAGSGKLGKLYQVHVRCFWNRDDRYYATGNWRGKRQLDGGVLFTQFSHFIDILYWVFGDIEHIATRLENHNHQQSTEFPDSGSSMFDFVKGGQGTLQFSTSVWDQNMESSITVIAENGAFRIGGQYMEKMEYCHIRDYVHEPLPETEPPNDYGPFKGSAANHHYVIENVVNTLRGTDTVTANAAEGMKVVEMIERIYAADPEYVHKG